MPQKTVFISYRRELSRHLARSIYMDLKAHAWDVFLDVNTIDSGDFDRIILNQIAARAHFILVIAPGSLKRCQNPGDWVLREIEEAIRLKRNIVPLIDEGTNFTQETAYLPDEVRDVVRKKNALPLMHFYFEDGMRKLRNRFLKTPEPVPVQDTPDAEQDEVQRRIQQTEDELLPDMSPTDDTEDTHEAEPDSETDNLPQPDLSKLGKTSVYEFFGVPDPLNLFNRPEPASAETHLPAPFEWIEIPGKGYSIGKYPVTNAQYAKFIEAGGYQTLRWWPGSARLVQKLEKWQEPRYWQDDTWNGADYPVVGVSWFEAIAFCTWLSEKTGEKITLPTDEQWKYAARGDDNRVYPWGNDWDCERCNNSVAPCASDTTTPVTHYEGTGNSYFGVVDMVGNVWEWCLNEYQNELDPSTQTYIVLGGSWYAASTPYFSLLHTGWYYGLKRSNDYGFRLVRNDKK
jgi:formylglycine-generating enzyme required for sulfatase activity